MDPDAILHVLFFRTEGGNEPVREWLRNLDKEDRKVIGEDVKLVQFRWPLGMPLVQKLEVDLWEVRSRLSQGRIARVMFTYKVTKWFCYMDSSRNHKRPRQMI